MWLCAKGNAFKRRTKQIATRMRKVKPEDYALGMGIMDGRTLAGEIGQHDKTLGTRR